MMMYEVYIVYVFTGHGETTITSLGRTMSLFPVSPRYAKMLALAHQQRLLEYVIAVVSACSVQEVFMESGSAGSTGGSGPEQQAKVKGEMTATAAK